MDGGNGLSRGAHGAGRAAISNAADQKDECDGNNQAAHEGRRPDDGAGFRVAQRRARRQGQQADKGQHAEQGIPSSAQALIFFLGKHILTGHFIIALIGAKARFDHPFGNHAYQHRQHHDGRDGKPDIRRKINRNIRIDQPRRIIGDFCQNAIHRHDHDIDHEGGSNRGEGHGEARQRMPPNRKEGRRGQRDQHQITRIRRDG